MLTSTPEMIVRHFVPRATGDLVCQSCQAVLSPDDVRMHRCGSPLIAPSRPIDTRCIHRGEEVRRIGCSTCYGSRLKVFACAEFGECCIGKTDEGVKSCRGCEKQSVPVPVKQKILRVGLITPVLHVGGVERWWLSLCRYWLERDDIRPAGIALTTSGAFTPSMKATVERHCPVFQGGRSAAIAKLKESSDIILTWAGDEKNELADFPGPVVCISHLMGGWAQMTMAKTRATHFAAVSEAAAEMFPASVRSQVKVIWNGIDLDRCAPSRSYAAIREEWGLRPDQLAIGYVGRWATDHKYPEAAALAVAEIPEAVAIYAGPKFDSSTVTRALTKIVGYHRYRALVSPHVGDVYAGLDCIVVASNAREGGPLVALEAMAAGVPVVATPCGMLPEIQARFGKLCEMVPFKASGAVLAEAVKRAIADREMVERARRVAWECFSAARMAEEWRAWLKEISGATVK